MIIKNRNSIFGGYPCCDMINNAIRFIIDGKTDEAIEELYQSILKANGYIHEDLADKIKDASDKVRKRRNER